MGLLKITFIDPPTVNIGMQNNCNSTVVVLSSSPVVLNNSNTIQVDYITSSTRNVLAMSTEYADYNIWLDWVMNAAKEQRMGNCVACASARPAMFIEPAPLFPSDEWGFNCMIGLIKTYTPPGCTTLASIYPPIPNTTLPGLFSITPSKERYVCFNFTHKNPHINLGQINHNWCKITFQGHNMIGQWARAGLYFYCGGKKIVCTG